MKGHAVNYTRSWLMQLTNCACVIVCKGSMHTTVGKTGNFLVWSCKDEWPFGQEVLKYDGIVVGSHIW